MLIQVGTQAGVSSTARGCLAGSSRGGAAVALSKVRFSIHCGLSICVDFGSQAANAYDCPIAHVTADGSESLTVSARSDRQVWGWGPVRWRRGDWLKNKRKAPEGIRGFVRKLVGLRS